MTGFGTPLQILHISDYRLIKNDFRLRQYPALQPSNKQISAAKSSDRYNGIFTSKS
jgi:hypothetical protein